MDSNRIACPKWSAIDEIRYQKGEKFIAKKGAKDENFGKELIGFPAIFYSSIQHVLDWKGNNLSPDVHEWFHFVNRDFAMDYLKQLVKNVYGNIFHGDVFWMLTVTSKNTKEENYITLLQYRPGEKEEEGRFQIKITGEPIHSIKNDWKTTFKWIGIDNLKKEYVISGKDVDSFRTNWFNNFRQRNPSVQRAEFLKSGPLFQSPVPKSANSDKFFMIV